MFDFNQWVETFQAYYRQHGKAHNDAGNMISLDDPPNRVEIVEENTTPWKVIGIHHLTPDENRGNRNVYIEVLCKQNEREVFKAIHWTWQGRRPNEAAPDIFAGQKPLNELVNLPLNLGMIVSVWPHLGEIVTGLSSYHPDETSGNTIGHHSFFVCFQEVNEDDGQLPEPEPEPIEIYASIRVVANLDWLKSLPVDDEDNITFTVGD